MIGFLLLIFSLWSYLNPKMRYLSYFFYLSFMSGFGGFGLWTDDVLGVKNGDLAVIYTLIISIVMVIKKQYRLPKWGFIKQYNWFIYFLIISVLFSFVYYQFSLFQILQGGRSFLLIFSFPILTSVSRTDFDKVFSLLLKVCLLTSVLYVLQTVTGRAVMPYGEFDIDQSTGLPRFYNAPANLELFLALTFLKPELFKNRLLACRIIFFAALVCTLGRTYIISSLLLILLTLVLNGKFKKIATTFIVLGLLAIPFVGVVSNRFSSDGNSEFKEILAGNYRDDYVMDMNNGTMLYRFAWIYERASYIINRPFVEQLFGFGLISDSQPWVYKHFRFRTGLPNPNGKGIVQLSTPDISYGNMLTKLGFLGSLVYLSFIVSIIFFAYKRRKEHYLVLLTSAGLITMFVTSFSGSLMSETKTLSIYFLFLTTLLYNNNPKNKQVIGYDKDNGNNISVPV